MVKLPDGFVQVDPDTARSRLAPGTSVGIIEEFIDSGVELAERSFDNGYDAKRKRNSLCHAIKSRNLGGVVRVM